jgi:Tfp pilus assembly protein PilF
MKKYVILGCSLGISSAVEQMYVLMTEIGERFVTASELPAYNLYNEAVATSVQANVDRSVELYKEVLSLKPDMPEALINLSTLLSKRGRAEDVNVSRELLYRAVEHADYPSMRASAFSNLGHLEQRAAGRDLFQAAKAEPFYKQVA